MKPYICKYFSIKELVPRDVYIEAEVEGRVYSLWWLFDFYALRMIDTIRAFYGQPATINNWHLGGDLQYRGFRPPNCKVGARYSQHRFGRAFDMNLKDVPADQVREDMRNKPDHPAFMEVSACEDKVSWLHLDTRNKQPNTGIMFFDP